MMPSTAGALVNAKLSGVLCLELSCVLQSVTSFLLLCAIILVSWLQYFNLSVSLGINYW